ncbi:MAG: GNAT family N-acetyltransferase [Acidimicrobiales bacterium]
MARHPLWPLFDLRLATEHLELRLATDDDIVALADLARGGLHDPAHIPFLVDFCHIESPEYEIQFVQHHWGNRANWRVDDWTLSLAVVHDGEVIGNQGLRGHRFPELGEVDTGSWLGTDHRGRGFGREMRAAVLHFAFDTLGAARAVSGARRGNEASLGVSRSLGYVPNGEKRVSFGGQVDIEVGLALDADQWEAADRPAVDVTGFEPTRHLFGLR